MAISSTTRLFNVLHLKSPILCPKLWTPKLSTTLFRPTSSAFCRGYSSLPPHTVVAMPALSPTMTQGNIGSWKKQIGESIVPGDVLVEIETDKALMEFECQEEGVLATILLPTGTKDVPVGKELAVICENASDVTAFKNYTPKTTPSPSSGGAMPSITGASPTGATKTLDTSTTVSSDKEQSGRVFISPFAKNLAKELNIPSNHLTGSGPLGRIVEMDVRQAASQAPKAQMKAEKETLSQVTEKDFIEIPLTNMRKVIAQRLSASKQELPHYYLTSQIDMDAILKLRNVLNTSQQLKLSINDFIIKASALALLKVPQVNSQWHDTCLRQFKHADISVAVATPSGLITPIVSKAETLGLRTISEKMKELIEKAKKNALTPNEYQGGTFTISNLGMFGIHHFTAIINPPQSAILAIGGLQDHLAPSSTPNEFSTVQRMNVTLSCDHRVIDGAVGAQFLQEFKKFMEAPLTMIL